MDIFKIVSVGLVTVVAVILLKQIKPELSVFAIISGSVIILFLILESLGGLFGNYKDLIDKTGLDANIFSSVLKVVGIGYLVDFAGGICIDAGVPSIADKILLGGKVLILLMCMPVLNNLIQLVVSLIP